MTAPESVRCVVVEQAEESPRPTIQTLASDRFPAGEVTIRTAYSSLNYKDFLACQGHRGIVRSLPHVPGIDLAGEVLESQVDEYRPGDRVLVTGYDLGQGHWGGWAEVARVPADWIIPLPSGLSLFESMVIGTAGFTAAQCLAALQRNAVEPGRGPIVVTGATGAVGSLAVRLLAQCGYEVVAVTGKADQTENLQQIGASRVILRKDFLAADSNRPLLSAEWAGAIDTVGGPILCQLIKSTQYGGCIAACGLVAGTELKTTVYPFLLRGISLCGAASADCPRDARLRFWDLLADQWKPKHLDTLVSEVNFEGLLESLPKMAEGQVAGRIVVNCLAK
jgi:acrylyl-CoA reductase (NADPH)